MRLAFVGATGFGLKCAELAHRTPAIELVGIVTARQSFSISYSRLPVTNVLHADMSAAAIRMGVPVAVMKEKMTEPDILEAVSAWRSDAFLVVGWYHMVPRAFRDIAPAYGLHASLLPDYSGGAPLVWAIINGEKKTGVTLFQMDDGVDSGDILGQAETPILLNDTIATVYSRIEELGLSLLERELPKLAANSATLTSQDMSRRRRMPQRSPKDGQIDWTKTALEIYNFVRAQTRPYPGAFTYLGGKKYTIWEVKLFDFVPQSNPPQSEGQIMCAVSEGPLKGLLVCTRQHDHPLLITQADDPDGRPVSMTDGGLAWLTAQSTNRFVKGEPG